MKQPFCRHRARWAGLPTSCWSGPCDVVGAVELSHATLHKMHQIAALAMSGSSALVAINALMLKRTKLAGITRRSSEQTSQLRPADSMA